MNETISSHQQKQLCRIEIKQSKSPRLLLLPLLLPLLHPLLPLLLLLLRLFYFYST